MQIRYLEYMIEIADCGSMSRAANRLFISPQALSASIARMEKELGTKLFWRHSDGIALTKDGETFLEDAKRIVEISRGWTRYQAKMDTLCGEILVYCSFVLCTSFSRFSVLCHEQNPEISITVQERHSLSVLDALEKRGSDLAVCSIIAEEEQAFVSKAEQLGFEAILMLEDELCLGVGMYDEKFAGRDVLTKQECESIRLLLTSDSGDSLGKRHFSFFQTGTPLRVENHTVLMNLMMENKGTVLLPKELTQIEPLFRSGMIRLLPVSGMDMRQNHYLVRRKKLPHKSAEYRLSEIIVEYYRSGEWKQM